MKRVITFLILVLALVPLILLMRWGGKGKAPWSLPAADGVRARVSAPRFLWRSGEDVPLTVCLRAPRGQRRSVTASTPIELVVLHQGETPWKLGPVPLSTAADVVIEKGQRPEVTTPLKLSLRSGPGIYLVSGRLGDIELRPLKIRAVAEREGRN